MNADTDARAEHDMIADTSDVDIVVNRCLHLQSSLPHFAATMLCASCVHRLARTHWPLLGSLLNTQVGEEVYSFHRGGLSLGAGGRHACAADPFT